MATNTRPNANSTLELESFDTALIDRVYAEFANNTLTNNKYFKHIDTLINDSTNSEFRNTYICNPHKFCVDTYGTTAYTPIILLVNYIGTMYQFHPTDIGTIITPTLRSITRL